MIAAALESPARIDTPQIDVRGVSKRYTSRDGSIVQALSPVDLAVRAREFVCIVGPSGCGKSTLLKMMAGTLQSSTGEILLAGQPISGPSEQVGMVFQAPALLPWRTVEANALLPLELQGMDVRAHRDRAEKLFDLVGLSDFRAKYPGELSGGMQQRVGLVRALIHDPALLLMDEPFGALDAMTRETMNLELLRIWRDARKTAVLVTHSIPEAVFLADRVVVMSARPGRIAEVIDIDIPRPRRLEMMNSDTFGGFVSRIRRHFGAIGGLDA